MVQMWVGDTILCIFSADGFGSTVTCTRCLHNEKALAIRQDVTTNTQKQAEQMMDQMARRLVPLAMGRAVMVPVPVIDRGFPNINGLVMEVCSIVFKLNEQLKMFV
jgi:hypothetical protein